MPKTRVCMLCSDHPTLDARVFYREAGSLQKAGNDVTLLVPLNDKGFLFDMGNNNLALGETTLHDVGIIGFGKESDKLPNGFQIPIQSCGSNPRGGFLPEVHRNG